MSAADLATLLVALSTGATTAATSAGASLLVVVVVSTLGVVLRAALPELRWWLALRGTAPGPAGIIRALGTARARPRSRGRPSTG